MTQSSSEESHDGDDHDDSAIKRPERNRRKKTHNYKEYKEEEWDDDEPDDEEYVDDEEEVNDDEEYLEDEDDDVEEDELMAKKKRRLSPVMMPQSLPQNCYMPGNVNTLNANITNFQQPGYPVGSFPNMQGSISSGISGPRPTNAMPHVTQFQYNNQPNYRSQMPPSSYGSPQQAYPIGLQGPNAIPNQPDGSHLPVTRPMFYQPSYSGQSAPYHVNHGNTDGANRNDQQTNYMRNSPGIVSNQHAFQGQIHSNQPQYVNNQNMNQGIRPVGYKNAAPTLPFLLIELILDIQRHIPGMPSVVIHQTLIQTQFQKETALVLLKDRNYVQRTAEFCRAIITAAQQAQKPIPYITPQQINACIQHPQHAQQAMAIPAAQMYPGGGHQVPDVSHMAPQKTSMHQTKSDRQSIRQKYSAYSLNTPQSAQNIQPSIYTPPKKKQLKQKYARKFDSDDDSFSDSDDLEGHRSKGNNPDEVDSNLLLEFFNTCTEEDLADTANCPIEQAKEILEHRPFNSIEQVKAVQAKEVLEKAAKTKGVGRGARRERQSLGTKIADLVSKTLEGYGAVDTLITSCKLTGQRLHRTMESWGVTINPNGALELKEFDQINNSKANLPSYFHREQPEYLSPDVKLKPYQLLGVNWLLMLYHENLSGILADEMGLGKTCQVVAFLAALLREGSQGPHLIVVPSSTLENWIRELKKFCPMLKVEPYYGSQAERNEIRHQLMSKRDYHIIVTTYQLAAGSKEDRKFLQKLNFDCCVYDEGHYLKNSMSDRYKHLMSLNAYFRLLLTGTPLQNNLKELVSLLAFILPGLFSQQSDRLEAIFKLKKVDKEVPTPKGKKKKLSADSDLKKENKDIEDKSTELLLSEQRIQRAKSMMTPFILRRRKVHVLPDLPMKHQHIEYCPMTETQKEIYKEILERRRDQIRKRDLEANGKQESSDSESEEGKESVEATEKSAVNNKSGNISNILMQLRQAANHPLLFRKLYTDEIISQMSRRLMMEPTYAAHGAENEHYIREDLEVCTDFELHRLCLKNPSLSKFVLKGTPWMDSGKVKVLQKMLPEFVKRGDRILIFSQFTMMLDVLQRVLDELEIGYIRMDGQTPVAERQDMLDQYHEEKDISVFLLSTKAGGFGINLACANVVILYDVSFNPHDDKQAEDRAHRVGQENEVHVYRLITEDSIDIYIQQLANSKLALDEHISGGEEQREIKGRKIVENLLKESLQKTLDDNEK